MEQSRAVSRCVAIASHGRRCQQSPFRGSPFCWHHMRSRKVFAPSRPPSGTGTRVRLVESTSARGEGPDSRPDRRADERRGGERRAREHVELEQAHRLAHALGPERTEELLRFLEGSEPGVYTVVGSLGYVAAGRRRARLAGG